MRIYFSGSIANHTIMTNLSYESQNQHELKINQLSSAVDSNQLLYSGGFAEGGTNGKLTDYVSSRTRLVNIINYLKAKLSITKRRNEQHATTQTSSTLQDASSTTTQNNDLDGYDSDFFDLID